MVLGVRCDADIFKLTAIAQSINREVYDIINRSVDSSSCKFFGDELNGLKILFSTIHMCFIYTHFTNIAAVVSKPGLV